MSRSPRKFNGAGVPPARAGDDRLDALVAVLDGIRHGRGVTRPELVRRTGLSRAVVAQRVDELLERGLIDGGERGPSSGGRAPQLLRMRAGLGQVLVADLGATSIEVALADLSGALLARHHERARIADGPDVVLGRVEQLFDQLLDGSDNSAGPLWGIGIGVPGPVEFDSGRAVSPPLMPGWDGYPVRDRFVQRFEVPTWVDNDVNVMALGERRAGAAREHDTAVFVKVGTGIGAGVIINGALLRGAKGCAGDVGHIQVGESTVCWCGNVGCLEALAGGAALARDGQVAARDRRSPALAALLEERGALEAADINAAALAGDTVSMELILNAGRLIGRVLATIVNVINPSLVVIGGGVAGAGDGFLAAIREAVYGRSTPLATRDLLITRSELHGSSGVVGAAAMVVDELFSRATLPAWLDDGRPSSLVTGSFAA